MAHQDNIKNFAQGGLDTDTAPEFVAPNDYRSAFNARNTGTSENEAGYITNPESTALIAGTRSAGLNRGIGGKAFEDVRKIVIFIYNSGGLNQLAVYDFDTNTQTIVFTDKTDSGGEILMPLDPQYYVQCILINQTYLVWADGKNEVGFTNLTTLTNGGYGTVLAEDLSLIKPQCLIPPTGYYIDDAGKASNFVKSKLFQATVQYVNNDFNYSTWSTWSKRIIPLEESTPTVGADVTKNNGIVWSVNIGSIRAQTINIGVRYGTFDYNIIKTVDRDYVIALPDTEVDVLTEVYEAYDPATNLYSFVFYNDSLTIPVPTTQTDQFVDDIWPATAIEKINGNIIALGDLKVGYERPVTHVTIEAVGYNPNLDIPESVNPDPLRVSYTFPGKSGSGLGNHRRYMQVNYLGTPVPGDIVAITMYDIRNSNQTLSYSYTVQSGDDLLSTIQHLSEQIPNSNYRLDDGSPQVILGINGPSYYQLLNDPVTLFNVGATVSKSIHAFLDNSSYQFALEYRDKWGRPFPLRTDNTFIVKTPSFAQLQGLTPRVTWTISNPAAPDGAVDFQWIVTKNNTVVDNSPLDVLGCLLTYKGVWDAHTNTSPSLAANTGTVGDTYLITAPSLTGDSRNLGNGQQAFNTGDYVSYNGKSWDIIPKAFGDLTATGNILAIKINPLFLFNQRYTNSGIDTVLTYDFTPGDRCTLHYYYTNPTTKVYLNNPCVDLNVYGYDAGTYLVKVEKSSAIDPADLTGLDIYLRLYSPSTQISGSAVTTDNTTIYYEIGERFTITNGIHDTLTGNITDGDVYFKTRQYDGAVDPSTAYNVLATDFNFSDFYASAFTSYGRPRSFYDQLEKTERKATIIHSENYVLGSRKNGLTRFFPENVYGDADGQTSSSHGAIQIMWQRNNTLVIGQELHFGYIPISISIIEDQAELQQVAISEKLFNNIRYNETGNIGIGVAKESFCFYNNTGYFIDPHRSEPMEISLAGIQPISGKMSKWFKATLQLAYSQGKKLVMYYNTFYNEVVLCIQAEGGVVTLFPFTATDWNPFEPYTIVPSDVTATNNGAHSTVVYNSGTGVATYTPTTDYVGNDVATFTFNSPNGAVTKNVCLNWTAGTVVVNSFSFTPRTGQPISTLILSNTIGVSGNTIPSPISITGDPGFSYSINGGAFTATAGTVNAGDSVQVRVTSSPLNVTDTSCTLTIDGQSATFTVTTEMGAGTNNFTISAQYGFSFQSIYGVLGTTGVPAAFTLINVTPGNSMSAAYTTVTTGGIGIGITGSAVIPGHIRVALYVAGAFVSSVNTPMPGTYALNLPFDVNDPTTILIAVETF